MAEEFSTFKCFIFRTYWRTFMKKTNLSRNDVVWRFLRKNPGTTIFNIYARAPSLSRHILGEIFYIRNNWKYKKICALLCLRKITLSEHTVVVLIVITLFLWWFAVKRKFVYSNFISFLNCEYSIWINVTFYITDSNFECYSFAKGHLFLWFIKCPWREIGGRRKHAILSFPLINNFRLCCFDNYYLMAMHRF